MAILAHDSKDGGGRVKQDARAEVRIYNKLIYIDSGLRRSDENCIFRASLKSALAPILLPRDDISSLNQ